MAHRSAIKRIQERDGTAARPMILCVTAIRSSPAHEIPTLELTDGWYRIDATIDTALARAIAKGKIRIGRKLAIMSSRLDSPTQEGIDVLEAKSQTSVVLTGNSTTLARWNAKLGFTKELFTASLRSLTADGGNVAWVEVVLTRMYAVGHLDATKAPSSQVIGGPWDEVEERRRQAEWEVRGLLLLWLEFCCRRRFHRFSERKRSKRSNRCNSSTPASMRISPNDSRKRSSNEDEPVMAPARIRWTTFRAKMCWTICLRRNLRNARQSFDRSLLVTLSSSLVSLVLDAVEKRMAASMFRKRWSGDARLVISAASASSAVPICRTTRDDRYGRCSFKSGICGR